VTLNGTVNANGCSTTVTFEYTITGIGSFTVNAIPNIVTGNSDTNVLCYIYDNLLPGINITYRVKAVNSAGTVYGGSMGLVISLK
jgi:enterochelin esterase-like enzyme